MDIKTNQMMVELVIDDEYLKKEARMYKGSIWKVIGFYFDSDKIYYTVKNSYSYTGKITLRRSEIKVVNRKQTK